MSKPEEYSAKHIKKPSQQNHVRHRIGMYLSSSGSPGLVKSLAEIESNSTDEAIAGHGDQINITLHADGSAEVEDHGRGIPTDSNDEGENGIYLSMQIGSGGKFNADNYAASGGLNGVGMGAVSAVSSRLDVTVYRGGKKHRLSFKEGVAGHFAKENDPASKFTETKDIIVSKDERSAAEKKNHPTGTTIRFWPDFTVFDADAVFLEEEIEFQLKSNSYLLPGIKYTFTDFRDGRDVHNVYFNKNGVAEMVEGVAYHPLVIKPVHFSTEGSFTELSTIMQSDGKMTRGEVQRPVKMDFAFGYTADESTVLKSYVNIIHTANGGTHESGLWRGVGRSLINHIKTGKDMKYLKAKEEPPTLEDVKDGFVGVLNVMFPEPTYSGQEKSKLSSEPITAVVSKAIGDELKKWLELPKNKVEAKKICTRIVEASRIRLAAKAQKDTARKKSALETSTSMPSKLVDCADAGINSKNTELLIVEGDSALGNMRKARTSRYQAILPLRGKVLNSRKATLSQILANNECASMIQSIGAGSGKSFDIKDMRYERIIIATDADLDGAHIATLLITFFYRTMPELIKDGRLFLLIPPLFEVSYKVKGKEAVEYAEGPADLEALIADLKKRKVKDYDISRNKGLGEMDAGPIWDTLLNPQNRRVKQVIMEDADAAESMLELAMGEDVPPRRDWIIESRDKVKMD